MFCPRSASGIPWSAISRELAVALFPEEDPGRFAAGFKEALAAESAAEAAATLDELGFARLDTSVVEAISVDEGIDALGTAALPGGDAPSVASSAIAQEPQDDLTTSEALKRLLGSNAPSPSAPVGQIEMEPSGPGGSPSRGKRAEPSRRRTGRPVLRSYLPAPDAGDAAKPDGKDLEHNGRSPVDEAGVRRVMDYERSAGRDPKEMPQKNPGYDIESRDGSGAVTRYIEVKSFSGQWSSTYAVLSRPQFDKAREMAERFWLYVVERAESDEFQIHRIQGPATRANHFMFDDGWRATAEPVPPRQEDE